MMNYEDLELTPETKEQVTAFEKRVTDFRKEGSLDKVSLAKLEEHFKSSHVYNSAAIEGNRLTLQETMLVLKKALILLVNPLNTASR